MIDDERLGVPSASGIERIALCPGSWNAEKGQPDRPTDDSKSGERVHDILKNDEIPEDADESEAETAEKCRAMELRIMEEFGIDPETEPWMVEGVFRWMPNPDGSKRILTEPPAMERLVYRRGLKPIFSGKKDRVYLAGTRALIIDYKSLYGEHTVASKNPQLRSQAVLIYDFCRKEGIPLTSIGVAIVQPYGKGERQIATYDLDDLAKAERQILGYIDAAMKPDAPRIPGEKQCQYCKANGACEEQRGIVTRSVTAIEPTPMAWDMMPVEQKMEAYELASLAERWAASVFARFREDLEAGISIPGFGLKDGSCPRKITDPAAAQTWALKLGVSPEEFAACCTVGVTDLEKAAKKASGLTYKDLKAKIEADLPHAIEKKQNKSSVIRVPV